MTPLQLRFKAVILRLGDAVTLAGVAAKALVSALSLDDAQELLTPAEIGAAAMPIRAFHVPYDDTTSTAATVSWNGQTLTVKRALDLRIADATVLRMLVAV